MKYKGTLIVVKDCNAAFRFYHDIFGLELIQDNDGNMELSNHIYLQEASYWKNFIQKDLLTHNNNSELYFQEPDILGFVQRLEELYPETEFVNKITTHSWGQTVVRFYDLDGNLIEVGTPA